MPKVRCMFYDQETGDPIRGGCPKNVCNYIHPNSKDWKYAAPAQQKPLYHNTNRKYRFNDFDSHIEEETYRPRGGPSKSRKSRSPDGLSRKFSFSDKGENYEKEHAIRRQTSISSIASSVPPAKAPTSKQTVLPTPPTTSVNPAASFSTMAAATMASPIAPPPQSPRVMDSVIQRQSTLAMPPPPPIVPAPPAPPPSEPAPMPPPIPLPQVPQGLRMQVGPPPPPLTDAEKATQWNDRIRFMQEAVKAHEQLEALKKECERAETLLNSSIYEKMGDDAKRRLRDERTTLQKRWAEAESAYEAAKNKLVNTTHWPVTPKKATPEDESRHNELVGYVSALNDTVATMQKLLSETLTGNPPPPQPLFLNDEFDAEEDEPLAQMDSAMDVDQPEEGSKKKKAPLPSRKRRRVDDSVEDVQQRLNPDLPTPQELEAYREQLRGFENTLISLRSEFSSYELDKEDNLKLRIEMARDDIEGRRVRERRIRDKDRIEFENNTKTNVKNAQEKIVGIDTDVDKLTGAIEEMLVDVNRLENELEQERRERDESYQRALQVEQRLQQTAAIQAQNSATLQTLHSALKAYTTRPPSPPMSPMTPSPASILHSIEQPLLESLRSELKPLVDEMRADLEDVVEKKNRVLYETTWTKISGTLAVLTKIHEKIAEGRSQSVSQPQ